MLPQMWPADMPLVTCVLLTALMPLVLLLLLPPRMRPAADTCLLLAGMLLLRVLVPGLHAAAALEGLLPMGLAEVSGFPQAAPSLPQLPVLVQLRILLAGPGAALLQCPCLGRGLCGLSAVQTLLCDASASSLQQPHSTAGSGTPGDGVLRQCCSAADACATTSSSSSSSSMEV
jgi:hypothetical protein